MKNKIIALIILAICSCILIRNWYVRRSAQELYEQLADSTVATTEEETKSIEEEQSEETTQEEDLLTKLGIEVPEKNLDWGALYAENEDIYAWIYIPGTKVDYPILQNPTELDYYLSYNIDGSKGYPGCIYSQYLNNKEFKDPNTILYGHNMKDGTMFKTLHSYEDGEFFDENPYIYVYTPEAVKVYEIFAACTIGDEHLMSVYDFWDVNGFNTFVADIRGSRGMTNHLREDMEVSYGDYLLTLSTCIYGQASKRWIVVGKLINV